MLRATIIHPGIKKTYSIQMPANLTPASISTASSVLLTDVLTEKSRKPSFIDALGRKDQTAEFLG